MIKPCCSKSILKAFVFWRELPFPLQLKEVKVSFNFDLKSVSVKSVGVFIATVAMKSDNDARPIF